MKDQESLIEYAKTFYMEDNSGHGFDHIERVLENAKVIHDKEGGDWDIIFLSVLFHDIHRVLSNEKKRYVAPEESLIAVEKILKPIDIDKQTIDKVLYIVGNHEKKSNRSDCLELNIVKDSDIVDSLGEIGLRRTLRYCENKKIPVVDKSYPLDSKQYIPDINPISTCHYVYRTMIPNIQFLSTKTGKQLAKKKALPLQRFLSKYYPNEI